MREGLKKISFGLVFAMSLLALTIPASLVKAQYAGGGVGRLPGLAANGSNLTATVPVLLPDGTAVAPAQSWANDTGTGWYRAGAADLRFATGAVDGLRLTTGVLILRSNWTLRWGNPTGVAGTGLELSMPAANTLYMKNAANPQAFWLANTDDGAGNYERGFLKWEANTLKIGTENAGTGTQRPISFLAQYVAFGSAVVPGTTDARDLGSSSLLWANAYLSRSIQGSKSKTITDAAAATAFVQIAVPTGGSIGGDVIFTATSTNGTAALTRQGRWSFAGADAAGTVTCGVGTEYAVATAYSRANTLVCTMTAATSTTNCNLLITCTDNLAAAQTMSFNWRLDMPLPATVTPQ